MISYINPYHIQVTGKDDHTNADHLYNMVCSDISYLLTYLLMRPVWRRHTVPMKGEAAAKYAKNYLSNWVCLINEIFTELNRPHLRNANQIVVDGVSFTRSTREFFAFLHNVYHVQWTRSYIHLKTHNSELKVYEARVRDDCVIDW